MQNFCVIVINNLFNSTENTYYKKLAHLIHLLSEDQCYLNKTTLTFNLTKLLAFITKKKEEETPTIFQLLQRTLSLAMVFQEV